ncbi:hypothetical protein OIV83_005125 [Microbotryomycetes sp. JL201]|nr:hypothetical protein OIV83_005125 [Microbotryomycetes sp. JL201]
MTTPALNSSTTSPFDALLRPTFPTLTPDALATLTRLCDSLVDKRTIRYVNEEVSTLESSLLDEYKFRSAAVKADYCARIVHDVVEDEQEVQMEPTIVSDADGVEEMSKDVDQRIRNDIEAKRREARRSLTDGARRRAQLEVEMLVMTPLLHWQSDGVEDEKELYNLLLDSLRHY